MFLDQITILIGGERHNLEILSPKNLFGEHGWHKICENKGIINPDDEIWDNASPFIAYKELIQTMENIFESESQQSTTVLIAFLL